MVVDEDTDETKEEIAEDSSLTGEDPKPNYDFEKNTVRLFQ